MNKHPEPLQQDLMVGPDLTRASYTTRVLADAWHISNALRLAGTTASKSVWSFTRAGNESSLLAVATFVRSAHKQAYGHPLHTVQWTIVDGARRCVCCSLGGYKSVQGFEVEVYTGCMNDAPAGQPFCKACNPIELEAEWPHSPAADSGSAWQHTSWEQGHSVRSCLHGRVHRPGHRASVSGAPSTS